MKSICDFARINRKDITLAGGKGASLGEMIKSGIPVPPGFVILAPVFEKFLKEASLNIKIESILHSVNHKEIHTHENASKKIKALILDAEIPKDIAKEIEESFKNLNSKYVAIRSSATAEDSVSAAWAGQLESYLNTTEENLLENVKKCWASLFGSRAIFYRFEKKLHEQKISVAVVVQKMVESETSGIAFSVHPVTQDRNQLIIEAGLGLGEAIVSGQITPDSYVVEKQPRRIIDKNVQIQTKGLYYAKIGGNEWRDIPKKQGGKQTLSDKEILALSRLILRIENHYSHPVDVEWAFKNGNFYIVQSRPITTLSKFNKKDREKENWHIIVSFKTELLTEAIIHKGYRDSLPKLLPQIPKFRNRMIIDNDIYIDLNETSKIQDYFSTDTIKKAVSVYKVIKRQSNKLITISQKLAKNYENLSNKELAKKLGKFFKEYQKTIGLIGVPTLIDLTIESKLKNILKDSRVKNVDKALSRIAVPYKPVETSREKEELLILARKISKAKLDLSLKKAQLLIEQHYRKYGWMHSTLFLGNFYSEDQIKDELVKVLTQVAKQKRKLERNRKRHSLEAETVIKKIKSLNGRRLAKFFQKSVYYRTARLEWLNKACFIVRPLLEEAARRLKIEFDAIIYLLPEEIIKFIKDGKAPDDFIKSIQKRQKGYAYISDSRREYFLITGSELKKWKSKFSEDHGRKGGLIKGVIAFKGVARGRVVIIKDRSEFNKVKEGNILITRLTTPDFVVAMRKAAAIVADLGGITSHAAVTSRELRIPCIVGTKNATKFLKDGMLVEVDANNGVVNIL